GEKNTYGHVGNGSTATSQTVPVEVTNLGNVVSIAAGGYHSLAFLADGTAAAWGYGHHGQVGNGAAEADTNSRPLGLNGLSGVELTLKNHSVMAKTDGTVWSFGYNGYGQLGDGTTANRLLPVS